MRTHSAALALALLVPTSGAFAQAGYGAPPPPPYQDRGPAGWDAPPPEFRAVMQQGYRDGVEGARHDFENHRAPDVRNRDEFRHPHVAGPDRRDYKIAFRRGYDNAVRNMYGPRR